LGEVQKINMNYYNNLGIGIIALGAILNQAKELSISKLCLVFPILSHQELLQYLSRKTTQIRSIEKLLVDKTSCFSNFNKRYYASLSLTINALQYLNDIEYVRVTNNQVILSKPFQYDKKMGKRAVKFFDASENIARLLQERSDKLYLNLRVEL